MSMQSVKTLWDVLKELVENRRMRYVFGILAPVIGILVCAQALFGMQVFTVSGTIRSVQIRTDSQTGEYQEHLIALDNGTTHYAIEVNYFTPTLSRNALTTGEQIDLWYEETPLLDPDVVALRIYDASGTPTKYTSSAYTDPVGARRTNLILAGSLVILGLLALAAARWLPTVGAEGKGPKASATTTTSYGQSVVGSPRRPDAHP